MALKISVPLVANSTVVHKKTLFYEVDVSRIIEYVAANRVVVKNTILLTAYLPQTSLAISMDASLMRCSPIV